VFIILLCWARLRSTNRSTNQYHPLPSHDGEFRHRFNRGVQPDHIKQQQWKRCKAIPFDDYSQEEKQTIKSIYQYVKDKLATSSPELKDKWENYMRDNRLIDPVYHNFFLENSENTQQLAKQIFREVRRQPNKDILIHYCGDGQAKHFQIQKRKGESPNFSTIKQSGPQYIVQKIDPDQVKRLVQEFWQKKQQ
jgi:hypothetical protein